MTEKKPKKPRKRTHRVNVSAWMAKTVLKLIRERCDECPECGTMWNWTGNHQDKMHHAVVERKRRRVSVRKAIWVRYHGPTPEGTVLTTKCENPCCLNPELLATVTRGDIIHRGMETGVIHNAAHTAARTKARRQRQGTKLSLEIAREIRANPDIPLREYAQKLGVSAAMIGRIRNNLSYRDEVVFRGLGARK